jgi:hypothetical protein
MGIAGNIIQLSGAMRFGFSRSRPPSRARHSQKFFGDRCRISRGKEQGKTEEGFDKLDKFGVIREIENTEERIKAICDLHIGALKEKQSSLIVAPTQEKLEELRLPCVRSSGIRG